MNDDELDVLLGAGAPPERAAEVVPDLVRLQAYRDGQLDEAEALEVEALLADDPDARAGLAGLSEPAPRQLTTWATENWPDKQPSRRSWLIVAGLAAAAALALAVMRPGTSVPEYTVEGPFGGRAMNRDAPAETNVFGPNSQVKIVLRTAEATGPVAVRMFRLEGGQLRAVDATIEVGEGGGVRLTGPGAALFGPDAGTIESRIGIASQQDAAELAALDGRAWSDAQRTRFRWIAFTVQYEAL